MDKGIVFGNKILSYRFHNGFGFYIESPEDQVRPADLSDEPDMPRFLIEYYNITAIKLPFFVIEWGSFDRLMDMDDLMAFVEDDDDDS